MENEIVTIDNKKGLNNPAIKIQNKRPLNLGVVGTGRFGIHHLNAFHQMERTANVKLTAMADIDSHSCQQYGKKFNINTYYDYRKMIEDEELAAISVATPDHLHGDIVLYALDHGLHVLVEKPLEIFTDKARNLKDLAKSKNLLLQVDFHKRYDPYHLEIKQLLKLEKIGNLLYGYCYMEDKVTVPSEWFPHWAHESSPAWFLGTNFIDLMGWLLNSRGVSVYAKGQKGKLTSIGIDTFDSIQAMVTYENDAIISYNFSWILPQQFPSIVNQGFRLIGSEGIVEADSQERGTISCFSADPGMTVHNSGFIYNTKYPDGTSKFEGYGITSIQHFAQNVEFLNNGGNLDDLLGTYPSGEDAYEVTNIVESMHKSIEKDEPIDIYTEKSLGNIRENTYA